MQFDYVKWLWSSYHESELLDIMNNGGLDADRERARQELIRRYEEQSDFLEL